MVGGHVYINAIALKRPEASTAGYASGCDVPDMGTKN